MARECLNRSDALSANQVVEALLDEDGIKALVARIPSVLEEAIQVMEARFYRDFRRKKFVTADHADDRAVELVGEVCNDFLIDQTGQEFNTLLERAIRMSQKVRPLFT